MRSADHLRIVDYDRFASSTPNQNIELVEVAMDQARMGQSYDEIHELRVQLSWRWNICYLTPTQTFSWHESRMCFGNAQGKGVYVFHHDAVPRLVYGLRDGKSVLMQHLEKV